MWCSGQRGLIVECGMWRAPSPLSSQECFVANDSVQSAASRGHGHYDNWQTITTTDGSQSSRDNYISRCQYIMRVDITLVCGATLFASIVVSSGDQTNTAPMRCVYCHLVSFTSHISIFRLDHFAVFIWIIILACVHLIGLCARTLLRARNTLCLLTRKHYYF
jgi:hypothetical protein